MASITKIDLDTAVADMKNSTKEQIDGMEKRLASRVESTRAELKGDIRELVHHFSEGQGKQNETLREIELKVSAILEMGAVRQEVINLVRELKAKGVPIDERRIFVVNPDTPAS